MIDSVTWISLLEPNDSKRHSVWIVIWQAYELDKEIMDYKEKAEFYRTKLQEIVSIDWHLW